MEFVCVLSVEGSLVSYAVSQPGENRYKAELRNEPGRRVPAVVELEKTGGRWRASPPHEVISQSLIQCIEASEPRKKEP